ncbi:MAG: uroporphyrinogen decarboxylase family protein [Planctomycetota bacterium]
MLTKQQVRDCLAGRPTPRVPAWLFWFDGKFAAANRAETERMRRRFDDDFLMPHPAIEKRAKDGELAPGEHADDWGCIFMSSPVGVGGHPARPIVSGTDGWAAYEAELMPRLDPARFAEPVRETVRDNPDRYVAATLWRTFYERMFMLVGYEELMVEIATGGELLTRMVAALRDFTVRGIELIAEAGADAVFLADDWGTQHRLMISPDSWARYFRAPYAAMIDTAHARGLDVWMHSCGCVAELVPQWIDIGLDVLSPLQAAALDLPRIAREHRGRMTFFGGIDVQFTLVKGPRESIREEVRALYKMFAAHDGRYMASPSNTIMPETPVENVWALFEAIREF